MEVFLGIDWGGTYIKAGIVSPEGKLIQKVVIVSQELNVPSVFISKLKSLISSFKGYEIKAIGIGAPGVIDLEKGFIYYLPNVKGWEGFPLQKTLNKELRIPVFLDNDANVFTLAEARLGAAKKAKRAIFLTLGTGLGGGVILDGKILHGKVSAAELGHVPINLKGTICSCGGRGCIETHVGSRHLLRRYLRLKKLKKSVEIKEIYERALAGEKEALIVWQEYAESLGKFLAGMVNIFNPQLIILGGGISGALKVFKPFLLESIKEQAMWPQAKGVKVVKAKLKDAGVIGAALLAKESLMTT